MKSSLPSVVSYSLVNMVDVRLLVLETLECKPIEDKDYAACVLLSMPCSAGAHHRAWLLSIEVDQWMT